MQLIPVTKNNIEPYVAFRLEIADEEGQRYYATIDLGAAILAKGHDFVLLDDKGEMQAAVIISRRNRRDESLRVMVSVETRTATSQELTTALRYVLDTENGRVATEDTCYHVFNPIKAPFLKSEMTEMGFEAIVSNYRYQREPGPPRPGEFPHADRAVEKGYRTLVIDDAYLASDPNIFEKLSDIYNRAFSNRETVSPSTPERIRKSYEAEANDIIISKFGDEVTGSITLTNLGDSVLSPQYTCMRRHWGTGSVDLMCRHMAQLVADRWNVPIIGYAEANNAASWKALERFGLTRVEEYIVWERHIPAGAKFTI